MFAVRCSVLLEDRREEADEGVGLGEEGVVAVVGGHLAVVAAGARGADDGGERTSSGGRNQSVEMPTSVRCAVRDSLSQEARAIGRSLRIGAL
jgi:hypothetical protein